MLHLIEKEEKMTSSRFIQANGMNATFTVLFADPRIRGEGSLGTSVIDDRPGDDPGAIGLARPTRDRISRINQ
jgi:hypothetical protein